MKFTSTYKILFDSLICIGALIGFNAYRIQKIVKTNILNVRLAHAVYGQASNIDTILIGDLLDAGFRTNDPQAAWWGGYYLLNQTGSYETASQLWEMAPAFSAEMLVENLKWVNDKPRKLEAAETAYQLDPKNLDTQQSFSNALLENEKWQEAIHYLDAFLSDKPEDAALTAMRGYAEYKSGGSTVQAEIYLLRAKQLDPSLIRVYSYLDNFYRNHGTLDQVEAAALEGLRVSYEANSLYSYNFEGTLVDVYLRKGELEKAPPLLNLGLQKFPQDVWWNSLAGKYYFMQGKFEEASNYYQIAAQGSQDAGILINLGNSYQGMGDKTKATDAYCRALAINPKYSQAQLQLNDLGAVCP